MTTSLPTQLIGQFLGGQPHAAFAFDPGGPLLGVLGINDAMTRLAGLSGPDHAMALSFRDFFLPASVPSQELPSEGRFSWPRALVRLGAREGDVFVPCSVDGEIRKIIDDSSQERRLGFASLQELADHAVITILPKENGESEILFARGVEQVFGWTPEELLGMDLKVLMPEELWDRHVGGIQRLFSTGRLHLDTSQGIVLPAVHKDQKPIKMRLSLFRHSVGEELRATGLIQDATGETP